MNVTRGMNVSFPVCPLLPLSALCTTVQESFNEPAQLNETLDNQLIVENCYKNLQVRRSLPNFESETYQCSQWTSRLVLETGCKQLLEMTTAQAQSFPAFWTSDAIWPVNRNVFPWLLLHVVPPRSHERQVLPDLSRFMPHLGMVDELWNLSKQFSSSCSMLTFAEAPKLIVKKKRTMNAGLKMLSTQVAGRQNVITIIFNEKEVLPCCVL